MTSAVNQRVFDIPLSGGFLMNDYQEDLLNLFDSDEIVVYQSIDELKDKFNYYRLHESERTRIVARASDHIFNSHTYKNRVSSINTIVRS
jgi:spore maturation protein CgeB